MPATDTLQNLIRRARRFGRTLVGRDFRAGPEINCPRVMLGSAYGGWWANHDLLNAESVVFGVGVGTDVSFDLALIERFGCTVHAFDPTPKATAWVASQTFPPQFKFHPVGLADFDGEILFVLPGEHPAWASYSASQAGSAEDKAAADKAVCPVKRLESLMRDVGVSHIDLLKIDIEGAEFGVVKDILRGPIRPKQLLIEYHYLLPEHRQNFNDTVESVRLVREAGYKVFARSPVGLEISFLYSP